MSGSRAAVELALPEVGDDALDALGEMPAIGAERQAEYLGGVFLGRRRPQVGAVQRPEHGSRPGDGRAASRRRRVAAPRATRAESVGHEPRPAQRVAGQQIDAVEVAQRLADGGGELRLGEHERFGARCWRSGDVLGEGPLGDHVQPIIDGHSAEVVGEQAVAAAGDDEVAVAHPGQVGDGEVVVERVGLEQRQEVPRQRRHRQVPLHGQHGRGVERRRRRLIALPVDHEAGLRDDFAGSRRSSPLGVRPRRHRARIERRLLRVGNEDEHPLDRPTAAHNEEPLGLPRPPLGGDRGRLVALEHRDHLQDRRPIIGAGRFRVDVTPRRPVDRGEDARQIAKHELLVVDRRCWATPRRVCKRPCTWARTLRNTES